MAGTGLHRAFSARSPTAFLEIYSALDFPFFANRARGLNSRWFVPGPIFHSRVAFDLCRKL
jgi:hypothetical protein